MNKRLSSKDFLRLFGELWQTGPKVKYQNPDGWISYLTRALGERFPSGLDHALLTEAASAVTGWDLTLVETKNIGLRAINLMKIFNLRAGITRELDVPSERYGSTPVDGPSKGTNIMPHMDSMLSNYYKLMGWDEKTGKPLPATLRKLGLTEG